MNELDEKLFEGFEKKQELVRTEQEFIASNVNTLEGEINQRKEVLQNKIQKFIDEKVTYDDKGRPKLDIKGSKSLVISEYFFAPIMPVIGIEPKYSAEKMSIVFDLYREIVSQVNTNIGKFIPNKSHFCRFACITTTTYNNYLKCADEQLQNVMLMIDDYMLDANLTSSQNREVDNVTTIYRAKVEQNKVEQSAPQTVVLTDSFDLDMIQRRIAKINNIKEAKVVEDRDE